jgi:hypothetical protein
MKGTEVFDVLKDIGATLLHHANSVTTSNTFLEQGGLASRGFVEDHGLKQTPQSSDEIDKKYGIWDRIFVDHVDIHDRGGRRKGPNQYGPVLFRFDLDILHGLPAATEVLVTKTNPVHWYDNQADSDRWFETAEELAKSIRFGDFDKMLVIKTPSGKLDFPNDRAQIILDDPRRQVSSGEDAYTHAEKRLKVAATVGQVKAYIERRECQVGCICIEKYATYKPERIDFWFT